VGTILVTGATGFLGSTIASQLVSAGHSVRCIGRKPTDSVTLPDYHCRDLCGATDLKELLVGVTCVIHAAGRAHIFRRSRDDKQLFRAANVTATRNLYEAAQMAGVDRFVHVSSMSVYGGSNSATPMTERDCCQPDGDYAVSKYEAEQVLASLARLGGPNTIILRPSTIYGAGDHGNLLRLIRALDTGRFVWIGCGHNQKSLIHVSNAAAGCIAAATSPRITGSRIYNLTAAPCSMKEIVATISACLNKPGPRLRIPASACQLALRLAAASRVRKFVALRATVEKWLSNDLLDGSLITEELGFRTTTSLQTGISEEVGWYRAASIRK